MADPKSPGFDGVNDFPLEPPVEGGDTEHGGAARDISPVPVFTDKLDLGSAGLFEVIPDDDDISVTSSVISGRIEAVEASRAPRQFEAMRDFLRAFNSAETAPLNVEALRIELLTSWKARLADYQEQVYGDNPMYGPHPEMDDLCTRFLDRDPTPKEFNQLLVELCLGSGQSHVLMREDSEFVVTILLVYATRFVGRIASLSDKLGLALKRYDSGFNTPYVGAHHFPRTVLMRADIVSSLDRQSGLGEDAMRENRVHFSDRVSEVEYHHPSIRPAKYAGDEVCHRTNDLLSAQGFLADLQADTVGKGVLDIAAAGKEGSLMMVITRGNRVMLMGPAFAVAEKHQKGGKAMEERRAEGGVLDLSDMGSVLGASLEDAAGNRVDPGHAFLRTVLVGGRHGLGSVGARGTGAVEVVDETLSGIPLVESPTGFDMEPVEMAPYTSLTESFSGYRIPGVDVNIADLNDPEVVDRIVEGLGMTANSLFDLKVERPTNVKAAFLGVSFKPFKFPQWEDVTPEMVQDYGGKWDVFMARVEELCEAHQVKPVYEDGQKGFLILGAGIYGSYPLNVEESLARLSQALLEEFPDLMECFSQTSGEVVQGPVGGDINVAGEPVGYLARLLEKLGNFRENTEGDDLFHNESEFLGERVDAQFALDEATYRSLLKRGFQVSLVSRKYEGLRGLNDARRFYFASKIEFNRQSPQIPYGYEEPFGEVRSILFQVKGLTFEGLEADDAPQIRKIELLANPDVGAVEDFREAVADQARLDGYLVLGRNTIPQRHRVYGVIQYVLKELFGGKGERFSAFLDDNNVQDADMLRLFFSAITSEKSSVDMSAYRELVIKGLVTVFKLYSQKVKPLCLFAHDLEDMDAESQRIFQGLLADETGDNGGILLITTQEGDSRAVTMSREMMAADIFLDADDVVTTGHIPAIPVETIELIGIHPEQGLLIVSGLLGLERAAMHSDLVQFCRKVMGDEEAWSPSFIRPWIDYLLENNFIERGNPNPLRSLSMAYSADLTMTQRMVQLRYDRLPERSVARHVFELASFLGESGPEDLLLECLVKDSTTELHPTAFEGAKVLLAEQGLMAFDGAQYHFPQGYIPGAGRRIVGYDSQERNEYREHVLSVLLDVSAQGDFVPSNMLFELSNVLNAPQRIGPAIRDVVASGAAYDPVNTDQLARQFLGQNFPNFKKFSREERVAYMEIFHGWIRVLCNLNRDTKRLQKGLKGAEAKLRAVSKGKVLTPSEVGALEVDQLDVKAHVYYFKRMKDELSKTVAQLMVVRDAERARIYIGFHRARLKYQEANAFVSSIKKDNPDNEDSYCKASESAQDAVQRLGMVRQQIDEVFEGEVDPRDELVLRDVYSELVKMEFMVKGLLAISLPFQAKKEGHKAISFNASRDAKQFMDEVGGYLFSNNDLTPLQKTSLYYLMIEGGSMLKNFDEYQEIFRRELSSLKDSGNIRAYIELQLYFFLGMGEKAQNDRTPKSLALFKAEIDAMTALKSSGYLVITYTNTMEYWDMQFDLADSIEEAERCLNEAERIWELIHDPTECNPNEVKRFGPFVDKKQQLLAEMRDRFAEKKRSLR
jgi:hypothetical protein